MHQLVWLAYQHTLSLQKKVCNYSDFFSLWCCFPKKDFLVGNIVITIVKCISDQTDMCWMQLLSHLAWFCVLSDVDSAFPQLGTNLVLHSVQLCGAHLFFSPEVLGLLVEGGGRWGFISILLGV